MSISFENFNFDFYLYMNDNLNYDIIKNNKKIAYQDYLQNKNDRIVDFDKNILKNFDPLIYLLCNRDLKKLNIKNLKYAEYHYIKFGYEQKRISSIVDTKKILKNFNWITYIYLNKYLLNKLDNERDCIIHYLLHGIKKNKKYTTDVEICDNFDWIIYVNYYKDLNCIKKKEKAFEHYIKIGIDEERTDWINLQNILYNMDIEKYKKIYSESKNISKNEIIHNWIKSDISDKILFSEDDNCEINNSFCIGISVYSDNNTPKERLYASYKCLNYLFLIIKNCKIFIVIDGNINEEHLKFLNHLKNNYKNCYIYKNNKNYGIAVTKNICINILNQQPKIKYFCLLDDDIFIKNNFINYSIDILDKFDIPILTNFNKGLPYFENHFNCRCFIKSKFFLGNILIFNKTYFDKFGYFREFPYKWGEEHQEFTRRYFKNSIYKNTTIDFRKYMNDDFLIGKVNTLHLHSLKVDHKKVIENKNKFLEYLNLDEYVNFDSNKFIYNKLN